MNKICARCDRPVKGKVIRDLCKSCYGVVRRNNTLPLKPLLTEKEKTERNRLRKQKYRDSNPEADKIYQQEWRERNRDRVNSYKRQYHQTKDKDRVAAKMRLKRKDPHFKELRKNQQRNRLLRDPLYRAKRCLRKRLWTYKKRFGTVSMSKSIGCTWDEFKKHLESKFQPGMTWENYGKDGWEIDHVVPLCTATCESDLIKLSHYSNLQPLWRKDNVAKSIEDLKKKSDPIGSGKLEEQHETK
jgi:hypothetical protein